MCLTEVGRDWREISPEAILSTQKNAMPEGLVSQTMVFFFFLLAFMCRLNRPLAFDDLFFLLHISTFCVYVGQRVISGQGERKKAVCFCLCFLTGQKNITGNLNTNFSFTLKAWTLWWRGKN